MLERVLFRSMLDEESGMASLSLFLYGEGRVIIELEKEEREVEITKEGKREDFYILGARLWEGEKNPDLYSLLIDGKEYRFGLRNIGLHRTRGFFLNGKSYGLSRENTLVTSSLLDLDYCDEKGIVVAFIFPSLHVPNEEEVAELSSHPSVSFWGYKVDGEKEEELRMLNSILYSLDKARATIGVFDRVPLDSYLSVFDVSILPEKREKGIVFLTDGKGFSFQ